MKVITYGYVINIVIIRFNCLCTNTHYCKLKDIIMLSVVCFVSE